MMKFQSTAKLMSGNSIRNGVGKALLLSSMLTLAACSSSDSGTNDPPASEQPGSGDPVVSGPETQAPFMTDAIIVDGKLFVLMERLKQLQSGSQVPTEVAYVAVIDTATDTEIVTNPDGDLPGIQLDVTNPTGLQYNEATNEIFVVGRGNYFESATITEDFYSGGIQVIDPDTYESDVLLDDGNADENNGYFFDIEVVSANLGFLVTYAGFGQNTLRSFNPMTGILDPTPIASLEDADISVIAVGSDNHLWVGVSGEGNGFVRLDLANGNAQADFVDTGDLVPTGITFLTVADETSADGGTVNYAYTSLRSADFSSGRIDRIAMDDGNTINGSYPATGSDIRVSSNGADIFQIGRFSLNSITRFDAIDTSVVDYQISVDSEFATNSNPYTLANLSETKAYLTRRGSTQLWIVNPGIADGSETFQTGQIDFSAYAVEAEAAETPAAE